MNDRPITALFVDYEHWYYSLINQKSLGPDIDGLLNDLKQRGVLNQFSVFGDFANDPIKQELPKIRRYTTSIINCQNLNTFNRKDHTDFIMLDNIYQTMIMSPNIEQFVLVTGDGHFHSVIAHLKTFHDKVVGVYGVKGSFSHSLKEVANWWVEIEASFNFDYSFLLQSMKGVEEQNKFPTFGKTVEVCAKISGQDPKQLSAALSRLIDRGYVAQQSKPGYNGQEVRALIVDWEALERDGIWKVS